MKKHTSILRCLLACSLPFLPSLAHALPLLGGVTDPITDPITDTLGEVIPPLEKKLCVIRPNPDAPLALTLGEILKLVEALGTTPYVEIDGAGINPNLTTVSAYLTGAQLLTLASNTLLIISDEIPMSSNGINTDPDTSLATVGEAFSYPGTYEYADTENPVRLYLIDTAVANPGNWIDANEKLTLEKTILVRGSGDPTESSSFKHGTQMLSLIGGTETGAAPGTPVKVINYDIYPNGDTTSTTLLAKAIVEAVRDHKNSPNALPSAICIATSSSTPSTSYTLRTAIESAIDEGIPVIVSAGNLGKDASAYIPSAYGSIEGVICTGSLDRSERPLASSNFGASVDLSAPGLQLRTFAPDSAKQFEEMTGTSPSSALTAAITLTEISANGQRSPAVIEATIKEGAKTDPTDGMLRATVIPIHTEVPDGDLTEPSQPVSLGYQPAEIPRDTATAHPDSDNDGVADSLETFHGTDPASPESTPYQPYLAIPQKDEMTFTFQIAPLMIDPEDIFTLRNGYTWRIECSSSLETWDIPIGGVSKITDDQGRIWITARIPVTTSACFTRLAVTAP